MFLTFTMLFESSFIFPCAEAFIVCENYSPPDGFNQKDLHRLLEKIGSPSGADDLGNSDSSSF